ncbi:MAG: hypothetical protein KDD29_06865 [Flavobacteriales bacterium]|nr:hypothetical protein [Flavobacteriales bacterium]MCB9335881.1 hypothetical protein [Flavobacteriales bacterium]
MKSNKILLAVLVVLVAVALYFFMNNKTGTLGGRSGVLSDFAFEDTTNIDQIFISDPSGEQVTLIKGDKNWLVNGKHKARPESITVLMKTFNRIAVKSPVEKAAMENVIKEMSTQAIKVEIYESGKKQPSKVYYVGGPTQNHHGTYMLLEEDGEKSSEPFVTYIPGFYGFLSTRFYANELQWRDATVFSYTPSEIKSIEVNFPEKMEESFIIQKNEELVNLFDYQSTEPNKKVDEKLVSDYLTFYQKIYYENVATEMKKEKQDSIKASTPYFTIKVTDVFGNLNQLKGYKIPNKDSLAYYDGNVYPYDLDRMYGYLNDELLIFIQYRSFDALLLPKSYFLKK